MRFVSRADVAERFQGKRVAIVGSGPGVLDNAAGLVDSHDVVVRVNNYSIRGPATGYRTDVYYSFFGSSIKKTAAELKHDGVTLCIAKCPDTQFIESPWHRTNKKMAGVDFRRIYQVRRNFWFCDTFIPSLDDFLAHFKLLDGHVPTTGFAAVLDVLASRPACLFLTGIDFFSSGIHNVSERWRPGDPSDPIGHAPEREQSWLAEHLDGITMDKRLTQLMETTRTAA